MDTTKDPEVHQNMAILDNTSKRDQDEDGNELKLLSVKQNPGKTQTHSTCYTSHKHTCTHTHREHAMFLKITFTQVNHCVLI